MTTTGELSDENKRVIGKILREMHEAGATEEERIEAYSEFHQAHAPIRSYTKFRFPK